MTLEKSHISEKLAPMKTVAIAILLMVTGSVYAYWEKTTERVKGNVPAVVFSQGSQIVRVPMDQMETAEKFLGEFLNREAAAQKDNVEETIKLIGTWGSSPRTLYWFEVLRGEPTLKVYEEGLKIATLTPTDVSEIRSLIRRSSGSDIKAGQ